MYVQSTFHIHEQRINLSLTRKKIGKIIPGFHPDKLELKGYDSYTVTLGDKLRGERATLGKTLEDVQKETRLRI